MTLARLSLSLPSATRGRRRSFMFQLVAGIAMIAGVTGSAWLLTSDPTRQSGTDQRIAEVAPALTSSAGDVPSASPVAAPLSETSSVTASTSIVVAGSRLPVLVEPEGWDAATRSNIDAAIALIPASVMSQLGNPALGPVLIRVSEDGSTSTGDRPYGGPSNFFTTNEGRNEVVLYPGQSVPTILHELGHAYNLRHVAPGRYAHVYLEAEMQSFLGAASWRMLTPSSMLPGLSDQSQVSVAHDGPSIWPRLSRDDPLEDFANSFAMYLTGPSQLQKLSPGRYMWFVQNLGQ